MSMSNALQTGVSGLLANANSIGSISNNIANANTDGYRRSFVQMVTSSSETFSLSRTNSVQGVERLDMSEGSVTGGTGSATDLQIAGGGFFVVSNTPNDPNVANYVLTRAGSFLPDADGNLRNAGGYYLAGYSYDASGSLGAVDQNSFAGLETVNVNTGLSPGAATTEITVGGNLPSQQTGVATPGDPFTSSAEFYSPLGEADRIQFGWQPTTTDNQWNLSFTDASGNTYGNVTVDFNDSGVNAGSPSGYSGITSTATAPAAFSFDAATGIATLTVNNGTAPQTLTVGIGAPNTTGGMTQFAGDYTSLDITANGSASGNLQGTEIDETGNIYGIYDNGNREQLYNIPLANVTNTVGLEVADSNTFKITRASGQPLITTAGTDGLGTISSGVLESSNVEIAQELTDLIRVQRAYSSNAKIVTTVDEMLDETTRLKR